jgi:asparaginyl-tRNA synthetase
MQKNIIFIVVRDGAGDLSADRPLRPRGKCICRVPTSFILIYASSQAQTYQTLALTAESSAEVVGTLQEVPEGKTAPGGHELIVDYWQAFGSASSAGDAFTNRSNEVCPTRTILNAL